MMPRCTFTAALLLFASATNCALGQIPAFPGAAGPGAMATGGRNAGADVYHVTNLEFDVDGVIPGSLKYGINNAPAAGRTIVFDVGGTIYKNGGGSNSWFRSGKDNITIAGQTAPGGITIAGVGSKWTGDNIILRNITVRPNQDPVNPNNFTYDGIATQATNSIIDHVSVEWFTDEGISATDAVNNTTVQYALIGEGLNYNGHSYGSIINTQNDNAPIGYHHNLYAHNSSRNPRLGSETGTGAVANFYNNVIYNWTSRAGYSALNADTGAQEPSRTNFYNNFYARGASNGSTIFLSAGDQTQIYQSGNLYDGVRDADFDDAVPVTWTHFSGTETQLANGLSIAAGAIDTTTAGRDHVLAYTGANWWNRDATDARVIGSVSAGTGSIINDLSSGVPATEWAAVLANQASGGVAPFNRGANFDSDGDGLPGYWEAAHGFDPNVANVNTDADIDGYSDLEEYLNDLAAWPAPGQIVYNGGTNQFARIQNWDVFGEVVNVGGSNVTTSSKWQPSRYDTAVIRNGVVLANKVGQHAGTLQVAPMAGDSATLRVWGGWLRVEDTLELGAAGTSGALNMQLTGQLHVHRITKGPGGAIQLLGGLLNADIVEFGFTNSGATISPGKNVFDLANETIDFGGVDSMQVMGDLKINSGLIIFDIAGDQLGEYDFVDVDGKLTGGGMLQVLLDGYSPQAGDAFKLFDFNTSAGAFTYDLPDLGSLLDWDTSQLLNTGELSVVSIAGPDNADFNGDEIVDGMDFLVWQSGFGLSGQTDNANGDANHDGTIDGGDLVVWEAQYGAAPPTLTANTVAVPEPSAVSMLTILILSTVGVARRRRVGILFSREV